MHKPEPVDIVHTHIRLFAEGAAITLFLGTVAVWAAVLSGRLPV